MDAYVNVPGHMAMHIKQTSLGPVVNIIVFLLLFIFIKITHQIKVSVAVIDFRRY